MVEAYLLAANRSAGVETVLPARISWAVCNATAATGGAAACGAPHSASPWVPAGELRPCEDSYCGGAVPGLVHYWNQQGPPPYQGPGIQFVRFILHLNATNQTKPLPRLSHQDDGHHRDMEPPDGSRDVTVALAQLMVWANFHRDSSTEAADA